MKLNQIRDVIAVAERGSLRSAARSLGLAQPALTRSIRSLEHELGALLFERRADGMSLTPVGQAFVRRATGVQLELRRIRDEVDQLRGAAQGSVAVGLSTAAHVALLPRVLEMFRRHYPDIRLRLVEGLFPAIEADVRDGLVDFYIGPLSEDLNPSELIVEKLFDNKRIVVCARGNLLAESTSLHDLIDAKWVATSVTLVSELELDPVFERAGLPLPKIVVQAETALSMIVSIGASTLLGMLPQQWLAFAGFGHSIVRIPLREELRAPAICAVTRAKLPLTPAAEALLDMFRKVAGNHARTLL